MFVYRTEHLNFSRGQFFVIDFLAPLLKVASPFPTHFTPIALVTFTHRHSFSCYVVIQANKE